MMSRLRFGLILTVSLSLLSTGADAQSVPAGNIVGRQSDQSQGIAAVTDLDGDGVPDLTDVCNNTPVGVSVDSTGRPLGDFDRDCDTDLVDMGYFLGGYTGPMIPVTDHACNPITQVGCLAGQKCTLVPDELNPTLRRTVCLAEGTVPLDGPCTTDPATGADDCAGGLLCSAGTCMEFCSASPNSCSSGTQCVVLSGLVDSTDVGLCEVVCDPLFSPSGCPSGEACYVNVGQQTSLCALPAGTATQGVDCQFINTCTAGYSCILNNSPVNSTGLVCA